MTHPDVDQIVTAIIDYEHALAVPQVSPFDPAWRYTRHADDSVSALFDPGLNPQLCEQSRRTTHLVHMHEAAGRVLYHYPLKPYEGSSRVDMSRDGDTKAVFAADLTDSHAQVYVLSDTAQDDCDGVIPTLAPHEVFITRTGRPVVRLSDIFTHVLLHDSRDGSVTYVDQPDEIPCLQQSPAQQFAQRLQFGTLTTDTCDLHLGDTCGGPTVLLVEHKGGYVLLWEACEACYDTARETARAAFQAALHVARAQVRHQGGNGNA